MARRLRRSAPSSAAEDRFHRFLKPGALARIRDSKIIARSVRSAPLSHLSPPSSPAAATTTAESAAGLGAEVPAKEEARRVPKRVLRASQPRFLRSVRGCRIRVRSRGGEPLHRTSISSSTSHLHPRLYTVYPSPLDPSTVRFQLPSPILFYSSQSLLFLHLLLARGSDPNLWKAKIAYIVIVERDSDLAALLPAKPVKSAETSVQAKSAVSRTIARPEKPI